MMDDERRDDLFAIFRREPEQARLVLKVGLITPPLILLWRWAADFALARAPLEFITLMIIIGYGAVLAYLAARLIHASDQWQVESVLHSRRLLTTDQRNPWSAKSDGRESSAESNAPVHLMPAPVNFPPNRFHQAEFQMRLQEEVLRSRREGHGMAVVALDVTLPHGDVTLSQLEKLSVEVARLIVNQHSTIGAALNIGESEFMLVLPGSDRRAAKAFVSKVVQAMGDYWCHYGLAVYPEDATDAQALFEFALNECEGSHQGRSRERAAAN